MSGKGTTIMSELKVLCGVPCGKTPVFDSFYDAFAMIDMPAGSIKQRATAGNVTFNLNALVDSAMSHKCSHLFIVEDDSCFASDSLMKLLAHDKPVVAGLCRSRQAPFRPYIYSGVDAGGLIWRDLTPEDSGLIKVAATGMGGILMNMDIFSKLKRPYFTHYYIDEIPWGQDVIFGKSLIEAGIDVYCDLNVTIQHATQCVISSEKGPDGWEVSIIVSGVAINIPQPTGEG